MCSKFSLKTLERHNLRRSGVFILNFEHASFSGVSIVEFEQVDVYREIAFNSTKNIQFCNLISMQPIALPKPRKPIISG